MGMRGLFTVTIFLGAFLLFQVQPLLARHVLPWFGGTPDTWTTCLLFFQTVLLAGYLYAHLLSSRVRPARQPLVHALVLLAAAACLPLSPSPAWQPQPGQNPVAQLLLLLAATVGLPYFALSATAPLLQSWMARATAGRPYRLYAWSNLGSMLALLSYPLAVEPAFTLRQQAWIWSGGFVAFAALCVWTAFRCRGADAPAVSDMQVPSAPRRFGLTQVVLLSATGSMLLLAVTNQLSQDVAVVPLLWVLPLALYLLTFIVCFHHERWYSRAFWTPVFLVLAGATLHTIQRGAQVDYLAQVLLYGSTLFAACMICHGEVVRLQPPPRHLGRYYLALSAGGALGGLFVAVIAPRAFDLLVEFEIGLACTTALLLVVYYRDRFGRPAAQRSRVSWPLVYALVGVLAAAVLLVQESRALLKRYGSGEGRRAPARVLERSRNFYGTLVVFGVQGEQGAFRSLSHGRILHGEQYEDPARRRIPLAYYGTNSGLAFALERHPKRAAGDHLSIGDVGMGCGTLATYGRPGDRIRFYEINPDVVTLAKNHFTFLEDSRAMVQIVIGDGRLELAREERTTGPQRFDVLVVDAFSGDAVPVHLLTRECFALYARHLAPDGVLALHVSSRFLDLTPVVANLCGELGLTSCKLDTPRDPAAGTRRALWVLASRNEAFLAAARADSRLEILQPDHDPGHVWTDDHASLLSVLRTRR